MSKAGTQPTTAPPDDPVRAALDDPDVRSELISHALARLGGLLADRPKAVRNQLAEDATQEAMKRALSRRSAFDPTRANVPGWLHGILEHVLEEHCRTLRKQPAQPSVNPGGWDAIVARSVSDSELVELMGCLPDEQRHIVSMHHLDRMSHTEIATVLGISLGASRTRLNRAMSALRLLAEKGGGR